MIDMPLMGLGTYDISFGEITDKDIILPALRTGYRHINVAENYWNLSGVATAIKTACRPTTQGGLGLKREDIWLTMKASASLNEAHIDKLLNRIEVDYFDLFLIHHPTVSGIFEDEDSLENAWTMLSEIEKCKLKRIGVANFYEPHLERLIAICDRAGLDRPFANEIEMTLLSKNKLLVDYCQRENIGVIAYSPIGYNASLSLFENNEPLQQLSRHIDSTPAQAELAWKMSKNISVIPKSTHNERLLEQYEAQRFVSDVIQRPHFTRILDEQDDSFPNGVTPVAEESRKHGQTLDWEVNSMANRMG